MIKYFKIEEIFGLGFITEKDQNDMNFKVIGDVVEVTGDNKALIKAWAKRNKLLEMLEKKAQTRIKNFYEELKKLEDD